jgi:hypothetical protein
MAESKSKSNSNSNSVVAGPTVFLQPIANYAMGGAPDGLSRMECFRRNVVFQEWV